MNYIQHPNLLVQFWASVHFEFDKILDRFVKCDGWLFQDMAVIAKKTNLGSIHMCVTTLCSSSQYGGKKERMHHFQRVNYAILDAAKTQWLVPWRKYVVDPSKGVIPPFLKRQVGGFFLLYMLYSNQPLPNRFHRKQRILMDSRDLIAMHVFNHTMQRLPKSDDQFRELARQLVVLFNDLVTSGAFEFSCFNDTFTTSNASIRNLLAAKFCSFTRIIYSLKDIRDQLHYITYQESPPVFHSLIAFGKLLSQVKKKESSSGNTTDEKTKDFHPSKTAWTLEEIKDLEDENDLGKLAHGIPGILKSLDFGPVLSRKRLTGVAEGPLNREVHHCAKMYTDQINRDKIKLQYNKKVRRNRESRPKHNHHLDSTSTVFKEYLKGNFNWVQDVLPTSEADCSIKFVKENDDSVEHENEEWETDEEADNINIYGGYELPSENKLQDAKAKKFNAESPTKKGATNLSMTSPGTGA